MVSSCPVSGCDTEVTNMEHHLACVTFTPPTSVDCLRSDAGEHTPPLKKNLTFGTNTRFPTIVLKQSWFPELGTVLLTGQPIDQPIFAHVLHALPIKRIKGRRYRRKYSDH